MIAAYPAKGYDMNTITVHMIDTANGQKVERRIDISNLSVPDYSASPGWECNKIETNPAKQRQMLEAWINQRANEQHATILQLEGWEIEL